MKKNICILIFSTIFIINCILFIYYFHFNKKKYVETFVSELSYSDSDEIWTEDNIVIKDKNGYLYFVDRKKNIIRRSGENISSAEVEASILSLPQIKSVAACAYPNEIYDEEVLAFIILKNKKNESLTFAKKILLALSKKLTYFKLPAYIQFTNNLPVTSTQKIRKGDLMKKISVERNSKFYNLCDYKRSLKIN